MGRFGSVKVLLENGADPCLTDKEGHTAEGRAKQFHHVTSRNISHPGFTARKM